MKDMSNEIDTIVAALEQDGVVRLPMLFSAEQLAVMQKAFNARLRQLRWNNINGYEKTEPHRHMVEDVLTLEQGFVDVAVHPIVKGVLQRYLGRCALVEARGWRSLPTKRDFHGWHGDEWYDQQVSKDIPKEVKLGFYLTDVRSGAFNYIRGTHRKHPPRRIRTADLPDVPASQIAELTGPAGTAFLFDTSGIHRQGVPMLEPRQVVFLNYHDPQVPLQKEDLESYRYHPLLLNAAFLGGLSHEDQRILGFGDKTNYRPGFEQPRGTERIHRTLSRIHDANLRLRDLQIRLVTRLHRGATRTRA
jgi:Phytanoyl-CoA dioxygenase (PhyH)